MRAAAVGAILGLVAAACAPVTARSGPTAVSTASAPAAATTTVSVGSTTTTTHGTTIISPAATTTAELLPGPVLVVGDYGAGTDAERAVAAAMRRVADADPVSGFVTTGDNIYIKNLDRAWTEPFGWVTEAGIELVPALGNHDVESKRRLEDVESIFGPIPGWYHWEWGGVRFVVLDSNRPLDPDQLAFVDSLATEPAGLLVAVFHHPPYSCLKHGPTDLVLRSWLPRLVAAGVDLVLSGHDHGYQRFDLAGVTYVVTGGGGHPLYPVETCNPGVPDPAVAESVHNFVVLRQTADGVAGTALDPDGNVIDEFSVTG